MTNTLQQVRALIEKKIEIELSIEHNSLSERERQLGQYGKIRFQELLTDLNSLASEWISVTDGLPPAGSEPVLILMHGIHYISEYDYLEDGWLLNDEIVDARPITHWIPLPSSP